MKEKQSDRIINILSIVIPVAVALILGIRTKLPLGNWTHQLPFLIALTNTLTSLLLMAGYYFIKNRNKEAHRLCMTGAFGLGGLFLVFYVLYHISNESTKFGGEGLIRYVYYFVLFSHILLSFAVVPLVLRAMYFALTKQFDRHIKVVRWTYPIWLYVSITGVLAYILIRPYYHFVL